MTEQQAADMLAQLKQIYDLLLVLVPVVQSFVHDVVPAACVGFALWLGVMAGRSAV